MMSVTLAAGSAEAEAPRAGADLAAARERMGRSLPEMADMLRIRLPFLDALERGRLTDLPGTAYALAFLRTYAIALGLDPVEMARRFRAEAAAMGRKTELAFPAPLPDRGLPAGALMLLGLVLAVGVYAGWYRLSGEGRLPAETVLPVPARLASLVAPHLATPHLATPRLATPRSATPPGATPGPAPHAGPTGGAPPGEDALGQAAQGTTADGASPPATVAPEPLAPGNARVASAAVPGGSGAQAPSPAAPPPDVSPGSAAAATPTPAQDVAMLGGLGLPAAAPLTILATADSWVQVRDATGAVVFSRLLHGGESWPVPARPGLLLTTGNAGGTELVVNGVAGAPLGQTGAVLRNVPLVAPGAGGAAPAPSSSG